MIVQWKMTVLKGTLGGTLEPSQGTQREVELTSWTSHGEKNMNIYKKSQTYIIHTHTHKNKGLEQREHSIMNFTSGVILYQKKWWYQWSRNNHWTEIVATLTRRTKTTIFMLSIYWTHTPFTKIKVTVGWSVDTHHPSMLEVVRGCADPFSRKFANSGDLPTILPVLYWNDAMET